jgi:hypothetical protein
MEADEVQARVALHDTGIVPRIAIGIEHRPIDPRESRIVAGAPDDIRHVEQPAIVDQRLAVSDTGHARNANDAGGLQILGLQTDQRCGAMQHLTAHLPADRRIDGQHAVEQPAQYQAVEHEACRDAVDAKRVVAGIRARQPCPMLSCDLDGDLSA